MGAWGLGSFENDGSMDWLMEFSENGPAVAADILDATDDGIADGYIESDVGGGVVALAEVLAASNGKPNPALVDKIATAVDQHKTALLAVDAVQTRTVTALDAILASSETSELYDLWHEAGEFDAWSAQVLELKSRLVAG